MFGDVTWPFLIYKVPVEPARPRAAMWHRLKAPGAVYLRDGGASLFGSPPAERSIRAIHSEIGGSEGRAT
jgi:hypothetical protein